MLCLRGRVFMCRTNSAAGSFTVCNTYVNLSTGILIQPPDRCSFAWVAGLRTKINDES